MGRREADDRGKMVVEVAMTERDTLTITLPGDLGELITQRVASGEFADASALIRESLELWLDRRDDIETWLQTEVVPTYDAAVADPSRGLSPAEVRANIRERADLARRAGPRAA